jgi:hypothetical protein
MAMEFELVTTGDLEAFRVRLLNDIREIVREPAQSVYLKPEGYKTSDVRKMLGCSFNKLVSLRVTRKLRTKKIGGTLYYNRDDIKRLLEEGF